MEVLGGDGGAWQRICERFMRRDSTHIQYMFHLWQCMGNDASQRMGCMVADVRITLIW